MPVTNRVKKAVTNFYNEGKNFYPHFTLMKMNHILVTRANNVLGILENIKNGANNHRVDTFRCIIIGMLELECINKEEEDFLKSSIEKAEKYCKEIVINRVWKERC